MKIKAAYQESDKPLFIFYTIEWLFNSRFEIQRKPPPICTQKIHYNVLYRKVKEDILFIKINFKKSCRIIYWPA